MSRIPTRTALEIPLFVGETVLSVERRDARAGLVITTTVKVEVDESVLASRLPPPPPSVAPLSGPGPVAAPESNDQLTYPSSDEDTDSSGSDDSMVVVDSSAPPAPNPVRTSLPGPPMVPVPTQLRRPANDNVLARYVVVFAGLRVGIYPRSATDVITRLVEGVPNARRKAFGNWDEALWHYAAAYQGVHPFRQGIYNNTAGYKPAILKIAAIDNPLEASYSYGSGPTVGEVDVNGLDLDADRLSYALDLVPNA
ncbi:hypothetical protein V5O48_013789 [Marasmius crinis-equi]|uniref:Uncharacterized protein n=1 Tax=Marasmius crinis-equi TaxID=585013 RepID=A0ABR3EZ57_9AGAR